MKISVSSYSFMQYIREGKLDQHSAIEAAHALGFEAIEFTDLTPPEGVSVEDFAISLRKEAERLGMSINAYTVGACLFWPTEEEQAAEVERLRRAVDVAALLGAQVLRHDVCYRLGNTGASRAFDLMLPTIAKAAKEITEYAAGKGVRTCTENHGLIAQDSERVERLFCAVDHDNYGLLVDVGNFACADEDSAIAVSRVAPYAVHVHLKDFIKRAFDEGFAEGYFATRGCNYLKGVAVGDGDIPVKQCLAILKKAGYDGWVSLEYEGKEDCIEGIAEGLRNLRSYIESI